VCERNQGQHLCLYDGPGETGQHSHRSVIVKATDPVADIAQFTLELARNIGHGLTPEEC